MNDQDYKKVAAWFIGPKGENGEWFSELIQKTIAEHTQYRKEHYKKDDPAYITEEIKASQEYQDQKNIVERTQTALIERLHGSVPFYTPRYQAHMLWDVVIPGAVGYMTAMLYNQNNVATEASPATSQMEYEVGQQLCHMLGFSSKDAWGHITADGTIANLEAMWAARNIKYLPMAMKEALESEAKLAGAKDVETSPCGAGTKRLLDCSAWELLNIPEDCALNLSDAVCQAAGIEQTEFNAILANYQVQNKGLMYYARKYPDMNLPKIFVPASSHYSWPKSATVLGLGKDCVEGIPLAENCCMDNAILTKRIEECAKDHIPVIMVVGVVGTTEEGAVDEISGLVNLRDFSRDAAYGHLPIAFHLHCDAAWGGYLNTMLIEPKALRATDGAFVPALPMSQYGQRQYKSIAQADTITVDPHKAGFIPYPAGSLCYRNGALRTMITFDASYIHSAEGASMGIYGLEGSKPGAAAAAVWAAHQAIPLDQSGYGRLLGECAFSTKRYYCQWAMLSDPEQDDFEIRMLVKLPYSLRGPKYNLLAENPEQVRNYITTHIIGKTNEEISQDEDAMFVLSELGTDVLINTFLVNFKVNGQWNHDLDKLNEFNNKIFNKFSISDPETAEADKVDYILMKTDLDAVTYQSPLADALGTWGITAGEGQTVSCLVNTIMNPWTTANGFMDKISEIFKAGIEDCVKEMA